jgi:hypothetical protein
VCKGREKEREREREEKREKDTENLHILVTTVGGFSHSFGVVA